MRYTLQFADTNQHPHLSSAIPSYPLRTHTHTHTQKHAHRRIKGRGPPSTQLLLPLLLFSALLLLLMFLLLLFYSLWGFRGFARTNQINYLRIYSNKVVDKPNRAEAPP